MKLESHFSPSDVPLHEMQDPTPLPRDWETIDDKHIGLPARYSQVSKKIFRSSFPYPGQMSYLIGEKGVRNFISLVDNTDWLRVGADRYGFDNEVTVHQFPFNLRRELTEDKCKKIVELILQLEEKREGNLLVHCKKGQIRTGMVVAMYRIMKGEKGNFGSACEFISKGGINFSSIREILKYS